eukprot:3631867-Prymnesium_polylepis.1
MAMCRPLPFRSRVTFDSGTAIRRQCDGDTDAWVDYRSNSRDTRTHRTRVSAYGETRDVTPSTVHSASRHFVPRETPGPCGSHAIVHTTPTQFHPSCLHWLGFAKTTRITSACNRNPAF